MITCCSSKCILSECRSWIFGSTSTSCLIGSTNYSDFRRLFWMPYSVTGVWASHVWSLNISKQSCTSENLLRNDLSWLYEWSWMPRKNGETMIFPLSQRFAHPRNPRQMISMFGNLATIDKEIRFRQGSQGHFSYLGTLFQRIHAGIVINFYDLAIVSRFHFRGSSSDYATRPRNGRRLRTTYKRMPKSASEKPSISSCEFH